MLADDRWWPTIGTRGADRDAYGHVNDVVYCSWFDTEVTRMLYDRHVLGEATDAIGLYVESARPSAAPVEFPGGVEVGVAVGDFTHITVDRATRPPVENARCHRQALADLATGDTE